MTELLNKAIQEALSDPALFEEWLERQEEERSFTICQSDSCPLAYYLTEELGKSVEFFYDFVWIDGYRYLDIPLWARGFALDVDSFYPWGNKVSKKYCLPLIKEYKKGRGE